MAASVVTRFAPSPTGDLHIGGARTALFNLLFARRHRGEFILRIDDTDRARSTDQAVAAIVDGLTWLGLEWDRGPIFQHERIDRHRAIAAQLLAAGRAYAAYETPEELDLLRKAAQKAGRPPIYDGAWRDRTAAEAPADRPAAIRLKAPRSGTTRIDDLALGPIDVANAELDDLILLRGDGSPTYMLSTVVDDHDLGVTHVIRGNEHLTNAARQAQILDALGWARPAYAHLPLIHGADGQKLSKRHGAVGVDAYREQGFLPEAMVDYLMRLGWSQAAEHLDLAAAAASFELSAVGKSPARFDLDQLSSINFHYIKAAENSRLAALAAPEIGRLIGTALTADQRRLLERAMPGLKQRAKTIPHLAETAAFYVRPRPIPIEADAARLLTAEARELLRRLTPLLSSLEPWSEPTLTDLLTRAAGAAGVKFPALAQPLRAALTGRTNSPGVAEVMATLGRAATLERLDDALGDAGQPAAGPPPAGQAPAAI